MIKSKIKTPEEAMLIEEKTFILASQGLRTLCFAKKDLTQE